MDPMRGSSDVDNTVSARNVYSTNRASTIGQRASAMSSAAYATGAYSQATGQGGAPGPAASGGVFSKPLTWLAVVVAVVFALHWIARKTGKEGEFANVRLTAYNVLQVSLMAVVGIVFLKWIFNRVQVPGLTDLINAA